MDRHIGRILAALRQSGLDDSTAIIVVSDHGETFVPGGLGRGVLRDEVRRVPMILRLPGLEPTIIDRIVAHQDIWPTLFDHLAIPGVDPARFRGHSLLRPTRSPGAALTLAGNMELIDLATEDYVMRFRVKHKYTQMTFLPVMAFDTADQPLPDNPAAFADMVADARTRIRAILKSDEAPGSSTSAIARGR